MTARVAHPVIGTHEEVHITGRRILTTLAKFLIFAAAGTVMAYFFGTITIHDTFGVGIHLTGIAWAVWSALIAIYCKEKDPVSFPGNDHPFGNRPTCVCKQVVMRSA